MVTGDIKGFIKEYVSLCKKYELELESDDPSQGLAIVNLEHEFQHCAWITNKEEDK